MDEADRSIRRTRTLIRAGCLLIVGLILATGFALWRLRLDVVDVETQNLRRLGAVSAGQMARSVGSVDFVLRDLSDMVARSGVIDPEGLRFMFGSEGLHEALKRRLQDLPMLEALSIVDSEGAFVNSTRVWPPPTHSTRARDYFKALERPDAAPVQVSEVFRNGVDGGEIVAVARRLTTPDGIFLGVVHGSVRMAYFEQFFRGTAIDPGTRATVLRQDGLVLAHFPARTGTVGRRMPTNLPWYDVVAAGGGIYTSPGIMDNLGPRFVSVHPVPGFPLVLDMVRTEAATLAVWHVRSVRLIAGALVATTALGLLLWALNKQLATVSAARARIQADAVALQESQARLAEKSVMLQATLDHMNQGLMVIAGDGRVSIYNRRVCELLDLPPAFLDTRPSGPEIIALQRDRGEFVEGTAQQLDMGKLMSQVACYERRRPNGMMVEIRSTPTPDGGMVRTVTDITARAAAEEMLGLAASHDQLTGLANRNGFAARLDAALSTAQRSNTELAVMCLDLDRFKAVNDTLGHEAGDQLLAMVAQRIREIARASDVVARMGGDEFAIVLPASNMDVAERVSQRLLEAVRAPYVLGGEVARIGVSIGIALYPADGGTAEQLLRNADTALYQAKEAGRNTWRGYASADGERERQSRALEMDFRAAMENNDFTLVYQVICDAATRAPSSFEALLRWNHPKRGWIPPAEFIPIAERTGLIVPLGRWVIATACAEAAAWAMPVRVAVNLSATQFRERDLLGFIEDVLERTGLPGQRLHLEVSEGLLLEDTETVIGIMQALRQAGVCIVLDDFGTAQSSLSHLRGFPFDAVKIDRSFMRALNNDRQALALVEAMLSMARALGLEVICEGVETQEQLNVLRHLQCRWVQGYLLGRPAPPENTRELLFRQAALDGKLLGRAG